MVENCKMVCEKWRSALCDISQLKAGSKQAGSHSPWQSSTAAKLWSSLPNTRQILRKIH